VTSNCVAAWREPCANTLNGCDIDLLGVCNCPQMRCNVNLTVSWSNSVPTSLCNTLYACGHVHYWCGSKDPSTVPLLIDTTLLQYRPRPCASISPTPSKCMGAGGIIPCIFNPSTRWWWHYEGRNRHK